MFNNHPRQSIHFLLIYSFSRLAIPSSRVGCSFSWLHQTSLEPRDNCSHLWHPIDGINYKWHVFLPSPRATLHTNEISNQTFFYPRSLLLLFESMIRWSRTFCHHCFPLLFLGGWTRPELLLLLSREGGSREVWDITPQPPDILYPRKRVWTGEVKQQSLQTSHVKGVTLTAGPDQNIGLFVRTLISTIHKLAQSSTNFSDLPLRPNPARHSRMSKDTSVFQCIFYSLLLF